MHFGDAHLGDARRNRRLLTLAASMAENASMSLPKQLGWSDLIAAYRFFSNEAIAPQNILAPHVALVREQALGQAVVLCLEDDTELDFTQRSGLSGLGQIGDGGGRGLLQHSALAVLPNGQALGLLDVAWHAVQAVPEGETLRQQQSRWNVTDVWAAAAERIGRWEGPGQLVHVGDRHADLFRHLATCVALGHHFVVRAMHDRYVDDDTSRVWAKTLGQPALGTITAQVGTQRNGRGRVKRKGRAAVLTVRAAPVRIGPPTNDPRTKGWAEVQAWAIHLVEENPPADLDEKEVVEWMLLSSLPVADLEAALTVVGYYMCRWLIEEWHRCYKQGCRIEASQLDQATDIQRLAAILGVVAVRLLQMRDLADEAHPQAHDPQALRALVPPLYIKVVARLSGADAGSLTPRQFFLGVARKGGYIGRKRDPRPGWIVLWRGWYDIVQMVRGVELAEELRREAGNCV
jgi:hypothetical protein